MLCWPNLPKFLKGWIVGVFPPPKKVERNTMEKVRNPKRALASADRFQDSV